MLKPTDFFVGIVNFFAALLPGALLTATLILALPPGSVAPVAPLLAAPGANWLAFVFCSYALGHLVFQAAVAINGPILDPFFRWRYRGEASLIYPVARNARDQFFHRAIDADGNAPMNVYRWAKALLMLRFPAAYANVERFEADAKFFRSLTVVLPLTAALAATRGLWLASILLLGIMILSLMRYANRRFESTEWAYRFVLVLLESGEPSASDARTEDPRG